ncbi:hypothetical protein, partial [Saccharothrix syringae]|uniref:hypothetical protein n=1 Tax=Saccharothrix syringae TaxID=103733 RepID=UPI0005251BE3
MANIWSSTSPLGRSVGSLRRAALSAGARAPARRGGGTGSVITAARVAIVLARRIGWYPSTATYSS